MTTKIATTCKLCGIGIEVEVPTENDGNDFTDFLVGVTRRNSLCQTCDERQGVEFRERLELEKRDQEERERREREARLVEVVGRKYRACTLETFQAASSSQRAALEAAKEFSTSPAGFLYLHGKPGVGKTHLAVGIWREHFERDPRGSEFWTVPELLLHLRSEIGRDRSEDEAIAPLLKARLLVLDDLGAEKITDWVRQAFYVVVSRRERDEMPTVITSNLSLGEIEARIGDDRITSRIGGAARIIRVQGDDARITGKGKRKEVNA